jgi:hypothetical protein
MLRVDVAIAQTYVHHSSILSTDMDVATIMMSIEAEQYFSLNDEADGATCRAEMC